MTVILGPLRNQDLRNFVAASFVALLLLCVGLDANRSNAAAIQRRTGGAGSRTSADTTKTPRPDYTNFSHQTHVTQQKLACDSCHKFPTGNRATSSESCLPKGRKSARATLHFLT